MRTREIKLDYMLYEKLKTIDTDINKAVKTVLQMLYNEAYAEEAQSKLEHNAKIKADNESKLKTLMEDTSAEFANATKAGELQLEDLKYQLKKLEIQKNKHRLISPAYEFETDEEFQKLALESVESAILSTKHKIENLTKAIQSSKDRFNSEFESRKQILVDQIDRSDREIKRALSIKEQLKFFNGLIDGKV